MGDELRELCEQYEGTPRCPALPARYGFVIVLDVPTGQLVVKASPDPGAANQAMVAEQFGQVGAGPAVHEVRTTETGVWTVMDRVVPGRSFSDVPPSNEVLEALAESLRLLPDQCAPANGLPDLVAWLRDRLTDDNLQDLPPGRTLAPVHERRAALDVLDDLAEAEADSLCHGDLSPGNVLLGEGGRFFLIDPRGVQGELAYDVAVLGSKAPQYGPPRAVARKLADLLDLDLSRILAWLEVSSTARV